MLPAIARATGAVLGCDEALLGNILKKLGYLVQIMAFVLVHLLGLGQRFCHERVCLRKLRLRCADCHLRRGRYRGGGVTASGIPAGVTVRGRGPKVAPSPGGCLRGRASSARIGTALGRSRHA